MSTCPPPKADVHPSEPERIGPLAAKYLDQLAAQQPEGEVVTGAQYELINAVLAAPGGAVVDRRNRAWILGVNRSASFEAAQKRGWLRLADEPDAAGQRAIHVTDEGRAAARRYAEKLTTITEAKP